MSIEQQQQQQTLVNSPPGNCELPSMDSWSDLQHLPYVSSHGAILNSSQKVVAYPHDIHANSHGLSCHTIFTTLLQPGPYLDKLVMIVDHRVHTCLWSLHHRQPGQHVPVP